MRAEAQQNNSKPPDEAYFNSDSKNPDAVFYAHVKLKPPHCPRKVTINTASVVEKRKRNPKGLLGNFYVSPVASWRLAVISYILGCRLQSREDAHEHMIHLLTAGSNTCMKNPPPTPIPHINCCYNKLQQKDEKHNRHTQKCIVNSNPVRMYALF